MLDGALATKWRADGAAHEIEFAGGRVTIALQDEAGKLDLNTAPPELLEGLFGVLGIEGGRALARAVVDRRPALAVPAGAQRFAVPNAIAGVRRTPGVAFDMRLMPFAAVAELRLVPGMTRRAYDRIRRFVTVQSGSARINPLTAPREILLSLPGVSPQEVDFLLAARATSGEPGASVPTLSGVERYIAPSNLRAASVRARAITETGGTVVREAIVVLTDAPIHPVRFADWRRVSDEDGPGTVPEK